jgi:hypothetical protein
MVGRSVNSASVLTSSGESVSLRTLMSTISPMMLAIGAIAGTTPGGSFSVTDASRSCTIWRL